MKALLEGTRQRTRRSCAPLLEGTRQRTRRSCAPPLEGTRQRTRQSCAQLQETDTETDAAGGSLQMLTTRSDFLLGNTWEQEQEQDACLPAYPPLENRTEIQTVSPAPGTRTTSAAREATESAAESEIGPRSQETRNRLTQAAITRFGSSVVLAKFSSNPCRLSTALSWERTTAK